MNIHEYQAKQLLARYGVAVPKGFVAYTAEEAEKAAQQLPGPVWVVKSQIHAGGRGAGRFEGDPNGKGGVRVVKSVADVKSNAAAMLGKVLVTKQTGPKGKEVKRLYVEDGCDIKRELYLSMLVDRATGRVTIVASTEGGMEIEEVAAKHPEKIVKVAIDPVTGLQGHHARRVAFGLGLAGKQVGTAVRFLDAMYKAFVDLDASVVEVNPLVVTGTGDVIALDAKMNFDDNALFRHKDVAAVRDEAEEEPAEIRAAAAGLSYVKLNGTIGCLVNGAGLAMSTMDLVKHHGGEPANFLDVGGGADVNQVTEAFRIILSDTNVKAILVNIFGGIMRCTTIATALVEASKTVGFTVPLVVRLEGTEVEEGKKILAASGAKIITADGLTDAAKKVVAASKA